MVTKVFKPQSMNFKLRLFGLLLSLLLINACQSDGPIDLYPGMIIKRSVIVKKDTFFLSGPDQSLDPAIIIEGENIVVDFNGAVLIGSQRYDQPDSFVGTGIKVRKGKNITLKNATIRGYKTGLFAREVDSLKLLNIDLSYNYSTKLKSTVQRADDTDKIVLPFNQDERLSPDAAVYLKQCDRLTVQHLKILHGQNGLFLSECNDGYIYENDISFNSGIGIGLHRSSNNRLLRNQLDWNVRGYSYDVYNKSYGAAGIFLYQQSDENIIAYNSATHCSNGFSLYYDSLQVKGSNFQSKGNLIYQNDFSFATQYGIHALFNSSNKFYKNKLEQSKEKNITNSNDHTEKTAIDLSKSSQDKSSDSLFFETKIRAEALVTRPMIKGISPGKKNIILGKYGPYDFKSPALWLRKIEGQTYTFVVFGPFGNWKAIGGNGFDLMSQKQGSIPATLVLEATNSQGDRFVELEYIGSAFTDQFGVYQKKGKPIRLKWQELTIGN